MCVCSMPIDDAVEADVYQLDLWAGQQLLWSGSFQPSKHGEWGRVGQGCGGAVPGPQLSSGAGEAGSSWGSEWSNLLHSPRHDEIFVPFRASVLPSLKWGWAP